MDTRNDYARLGAHPEPGVNGSALDKRHYNQIGITAESRGNDAAVRWTAPGTYALLHGIAQCRLHRKAHSNRRPRVTFRLPAEDGFSLVIRSSVTATQSGWCLEEGLTLDLVSDSGRVVLQATIDEDDLLRVIGSRNSNLLSTLNRTLLHLTADPALVLALNTCRCAICQHRLTDPESIARGMGPWCWATAQARLRPVIDQRQEGTRHV